MNRATRRDITRSRRRGRGNRRTTSRQASTVNAGAIVSRIAHQLARWILGIGALLGGAAGVHYGWEALCTSQRLLVRHVDLTGNRKARPLEVQAYINIEIGDSILRSDIDAAALRLRRHPWVREATVRRQLPDRVLVEVTEHEPSLIVALGDLYLANQSGELFKRLSAGDDVALPVVTGLSRDKGQSSESVSRVVQSAIHLAESLRRKGPQLGELEEAHWDEQLGWTIVTQRVDGAFLEVHLGTDAVGRIPLAVEALGVLEEDGQDPEMLWVAGRKEPARVHARLRSMKTARIDTTLIAKAR